LFDEKNQRSKISCQGPFKLVKKLNYNLFTNMRVKCCKKIKYRVKKRDVQYLIAVLKLPW
jgi:hypothetical protein